MSVSSEDALSDALIATSKGDKQAFGTLYERLSPSLFALVLRITRHRATAEEVLRDAFVAIWKTAERFAPERDDALAFMTSAVRSLGLDRAAQGMSRPGAIATPIAELERRTLDRLSDDAAGHLLRSALRALPEGERRVLLLAYLNGADYEEISLSLDLAPGTVSVWVKRALHKLRKTASTAPEPSGLEQDSLDILAGEFVLGTLNETARRQSMLLATANAEFADRIRFWQTTLAPLALTPVPVSPLGDLWQQVRHLTIDLPRAAAAPPAVTSRLSSEPEPEPEPVQGRRLWRSLSIGLACLVIVLAATIGVLLDRRGSWQSHRFAVLVDAQREPVWLARSDATGRQLEIAPIGKIDAPSGRVFQLWLTTAPDMPALSLGLLSPQGEIIPKLPSGFAQGRALEVSLEPPGGSPNGIPSGYPSALGTLVDPSEPAAARH